MKRGTIQAEDRQEEEELTGQKDQSTSWSPWRPEGRSVEAEGRRTRPVLAEAACDWLIQTLPSGKAKYSHHQDNAGSPTSRHF